MALVYVRELDKLQFGNIPQTRHQLQQFLTANRRYSPAQGSIKAHRNRAACSNHSYFLHLSLLIENKLSLMGASAPTI
jgi:hypothetical protein